MLFPICLGKHVLMFLKTNRLGFKQQLNYDIFQKKSFSKKAKRDNYTLYTLCYAGQN